MFRFRLATAGLLIAALAAACSSPGASPTEEASAEPPAEETASAAPSETAEETPEATSGDGSGAGELADILPTEVGGLTIEYQFAEGDEAFGAEGMPPEAAAFLERVGGDPSDISSGFGIGLDPQTNSALSILAFRIAGADESRLRDEFRAVIEEDGTQVVAETTMAGKDVLSFGVPESEPTAFLYVKGDTVFMVGGNPPELIDETISLLP